MALTDFQRDLCRLIAASRREGKDSYVAGGVALNTFLGAPRVSRDIDLFHDTDEALRVSWARDRSLLASQGYGLEILRESPSFVEALVSRAPDDRVIVQWVRDSAFRFFPLLEDDTFGLVLHPFDLATNKVLALAGRLEPRDWVDTIESHEKIQSLGYLVWAACGKDPGFGPGSLLAEAHRSGRYSQVELDVLAFQGDRPDARALGRRWHAMLREAAEIIDLLPEARVGQVVVTKSGDLYTGNSTALRSDLARESIWFHEGRIGGVWPTVKPSSSRS